jgi:hypothetical protein
MNWRKVSWALRVMRVTATYNLNFGYHVGWLVSAELNTIDSKYGGSK